MSEKTSSRILIVDDVPDNLRLLSRLLTRRGYVVDTAENRDEAMQNVQAHPPDLILLDVNMPDIDGYTICRELKADDDYRDIPIIFLSALTEPQDKVRGFEAGGIDYITKPFHYHEVIARVQTQIDLYRQRRENKILRGREIAYYQTLAELKEQLLHATTHDLKNPLTSIKLNIALVRARNRNSDEKTKKYLRTIENDINRILNLLSDLANLAQLETGGTLHELTVMDLGGLLNEKIQTFRPSAQEKQVELALKHPDESQSVSIDPQQIAHVVDNFLLHALTYAPVQTEITLSYYQNNGDVCIEVTSTDLLLTADELETLMAGFTVSKSGQRLGLPLARAIVERHGGRIWAETNGRGTTFGFTLPRVE